MYGHIMNISEVPSIDLVISNKPEFHHLETKGPTQIYPKVSIRAQ